AAQPIPPFVAVMSSGARESRCIIEVALDVSQPAFIQRRRAFGQALGPPKHHPVIKSASQGVPMAAMNGTIKRIVSDKGFGFILGSDGNEYFFHNSACRDTRFDALREGQAVTFEKGQGPKGPRGENVRLAQAPPLLGIAPA